MTGAPTPEDLPANPEILELLCEYARLRGADVEQEIEIMEEYLDAPWIAVVIVERLKPESTGLDRDH